MESRETAPKKPQATIEDPDIRNASFYSNRYVTWSRHARITIRWDQLKHKNAVREQSFDMRIYRLDIKKVHLVKNSLLQTSLVVNQQCVFQVAASLCCD